MARNEENKLKILACAKEIVKTEGLESLNISKIVKGCSISKRTFYEAFSSKDDLLNELKNVSDDELNIIEEREVIHMTMHCFPRLITRFTEIKG